MVLKAWVVAAGSIVSAKNEGDSVYNVRKRYTSINKRDLIKKLFQTIRNEQIYKFSNTKYNDF